MTLPNHTNESQGPPENLVHAASLRQIMVRYRKNIFLTTQPIQSALLLLVIACLQAFPVNAQDGRFEIRSANSRLGEGVYYATARVDYRLSDKAMEALENGVTLTFQIQVELTRKRRFLPDANIASLQKNYQLSYQPLTRHYVVKNLNRGIQSSHVTLFSALRNMGRIVDLPIIDAALLEAGQQYEIAIRAVLDHNNLPGPLRLLAFWRSGFRLQSNWYQWYLVK